MKGRKAATKKEEADTNAGSDSNHEPVQKRLRGRPKREVNTVEKEENGTKNSKGKSLKTELENGENEAGSQKRSRGRPKKNEMNQDDDAVPVPPKRSKGRPKASKKSNPDEEEEDTNKDEEEKEEDARKESKRVKRKIAVKKEEVEDDEDESPPKRAKGRPKTKKEKDDDDDDDFEKEKKLKKGKKGSKKSTASKKSAAKKNSKEATGMEKTGMERSVVKKGLAAVDGVCPIAATSHVFCEEEDIWDCMLNQTNIQFNNNKYYIIQLLKDDGKAAYSVWMRWGRVGLPGQNALKPFGGNLDKAKDAFKKKFSDKTKNDWELRDCFEKVFGKYDVLKMDYSGQDETDNVKKENEETVVKPRKKVESKLEAQVKALIELICDVKAMEEAVIEMKYDAKKAPLGKLTSDQVKAGYAALNKIESIILEAGRASNKDLVEACNAFYTRIPHYFGMKVPPLISTKSEIQEKLALLQALGDIQAAMSVLNQPLNENMHPVDQHYEGLKCDIHALDKSDVKYKLLEKYLSTTHGKTHSMYKMKVVEIFEANKSSEETRFKDIGNRMLLWHGSRLTNYAGIISQGLRIAPPEAPSTGYMFGKGIYFADMASKSANYCMPSYQHKTGLLILCEVSLGKCNELLNADYDAHKLPTGCHSVKGLGRIAPDPKNQTTLDDGIALPMGPGIETKIDNKSGYSLQYNEYIVYDVAQVKTKYLMKVEFSFK